MSDNFIIEARKSATQWAQDLVKRDPNSWAILDTETTGLDSRDQVVQIGIIDGAGNVLINNQLVKPTIEISEGARSVHGISNEMLEQAPSFADVLPTLQSILSGRLLVIYNASFDYRILQQTSLAISENFDLGVEDCHCAMLKYAEFVGEWNDYRGSFKWQRLPSGDHSAIGDCLATLKIIRMMAQDDLQ